MVWASPGLTPTSDYTSWTKSYDSASISTMVTEAVSQFILTGTFYGWPGSDATPTALYDIDATYPDSTWDYATCVANENAGVTLSWTFERGSTTLYQQCGYVNGNYYWFTASTRCRPHTFFSVESCTFLLPPRGETRGVELLRQNGQCCRLHNEWNDEFMLCYRF